MQWRLTLIRVSVACHMPVVSGVGHFHVEALLFCPNATASFECGTAPNAFIGILDFCNQAVVVD